MAITVFAGCSRHTQTGQIFIATQSGQNVKLGAVEILAFDEATINSFVKQRQMEIVQQHDKLQQQAEMIQNEFQKVEEPYKKAVTEYLDAQSRYNDQADLIRREAEKAAKLYNDKGVATANVNDCYSKISDADLQIAYILKQAQQRAAIAQDELTRQEIFSRTNYDPTILQANDNKRYYQATLNDLLSKTNELERLIVEQQAILGAENQKLAKIETELTEKEKSKKNAQDSYYDVRRRLGDANQALTDFFPSQILLNDLPQPVARTVSDADGKFLLKLPPGRRFALFAHAQRTVGQVEDYYWLVWTDRNVDLLLNNANMFGTRSSEQVMSTITPRQE